MRKLFLLVGLLLFTLPVFSQRTSKLHGPKAKNVKPWMKPAKKKFPALFVQKNRRFLKGPAAKNAKIWQRTNQEQFVQVLAFGNRRNSKIPTGKVHKPWNRKDKGRYFRFTQAKPLLIR